MGAKPTRSDLTPCPSPTERGESEGFTTEIAEDREGRTEGREVAGAEARAARRVVVGLAAREALDAGIGVLLAGGMEDLTPY
jgi:hypothetical protein